MDARHFFFLVERLPAYQGVLAARLNNESSSTTSASGSTADGRDDRQVRVYEDLDDNPAAAALFD
ncbi:hypothetical protein ACFVWN_01085 [Nocardiopsis flavescens]|uniref:hypothetical protein n=1 Tax=Nocardiopsis flavescens TaxID=758803 RepID=UPI00365745AD